MRTLLQSLNVVQGLFRSIGFGLAFTLTPTLLKVQGRIKSLDLKGMIESLILRSARFWRKLRGNGVAGTLRLTANAAVELGQKIRSTEVKEIPAYLQAQLWELDSRVRSIGISEDLDDFEKRKLGLFNQLNFLGLITGIIAPIAGIFTDNRLPAISWIIAFLPGIVSMLVLFLNHHRKYSVATTSYFILQPFVTSLVYLGGINLGVELFFILYGILSVFFLPRISHMMFSLGFSMISYFMLAVVLKNYTYQLESASYFFFLFNQILAIAFIFYGLFLIKQENTGYQFNILAKNRELHKVNLEIENQKEDIAEKAIQLEQKTIELTELNSVKNKLFSVISHDLKTPMYALRNLFSNLQQTEISGDEIKSLIPDVVIDLNYTTGLMENLLSWAKTQMQSDTARPQVFNVRILAEDVCGLLRLQAEGKSVELVSDCRTDHYVFADRDMVHLVFRNLVSNAIKFTPQNGKVIVQIAELKNMIQVSVRDSGIGMDKATLNRLFNEFYTSKGTANEQGTGLGLILCKEFIVKNGGRIEVKSEVGEGSEFRFTLPKTVK